MSLIGLCGHDNTLQIFGDATILGKSIITDSSSEFSRKNYIRNTEAYFNKIYKSKSESNSDLYEEELEDILQVNKVVCPHGLSGMYLPGALGKDTQISNRLIQNIAKVQAPDRGAEALPSKDYHTIGAAYMACNLVRDGVPAPLIKSLTSMVIHNYRNKRLCELNGDSDVAFDHVIRKWGIKGTADLVFKYSKDPKKCSPRNSSVFLVTGSSSSANKTQESDFAINNCTPSPNFHKKNLEKSSCLALEKIKRQNPKLIDSTPPPAVPKPCIEQYSFQLLSNTFSTRYLAAYFYESTYDSQGLK